MIALAAALFAVGFGVVAIGQQAFGLYRPAGLPVPAREMPKSGPTDTAAVKTKTYADYLAEAEIAFARMDRTCSAADRKAFGRAFHQLLAATRALRLGLIPPGDLRPATARSLNGARPDALLVDAALSPDGAVFAQVFDATRRGVLTDFDLPQGMSVLLASHMSNARAGTGDELDPLAAMTVKRPTRCRPL
jgi:hypothetical protein